MLRLAVLRLTMRSLTRVRPLSGRAVGSLGLGARGRASLPRLVAVSRHAPGVAAAPVAAAARGPLPLVTAGLGAVPGPGPPLVLALRLLALVRIVGAVGGTPFLPVPAFLARHFSGSSDHLE